MISSGRKVFLPVMHVADKLSYASVHSKNPGGSAFGAFACVKGEFFGIAIADLISVIKSINTIMFFLTTVYNYIAEQ